VKTVTVLAAELVSGTDVLRQCDDIFLPTPAVTYELVLGGWGDAETSDFECLCVRTLKQKRLELSTPNSVHVMLV